MNSKRGKDTHSKGGKGPIGRKGKQASVVGMGIGCAFIVIGLMAVAVGVVAISNSVLRLLGYSV